MKALLDKGSNATSISLHTLTLGEPNRCFIYQEMGKKQLALADFQEAARLYKKQGDTARYQDTNNRIKQLGILSRLLHAITPQP